MLEILSFSPYARRSGVSSRNVALSPAKSGFVYTVMPPPKRLTCADAGTAMNETADATSSNHTQVPGRRICATMMPPLEALAARSATGMPG